MSTENLTGYDAWKSRLPEDESGYIDNDESCDAECGCLTNVICEHCGNCREHCSGHDLDEVRADQGLDDDIDW